MKAGQFNIDEYLNRLNEEAEGGNLPEPEGMVIPEENQKAYQWLKKEYQKAQTEVKVEIHLGRDKFDEETDMQADPNAQQEFKPGMFGEVKTADAKNVDAEKAGDKSEGGNSLEDSKKTPTFGKEEGEKPTDKARGDGEKPTDKAPGDGEKPTDTEKGASKPASDDGEKSTEKTSPEKSDEKSEDKPEHKKEDGPEVKKIDLKTKKK